MSDRSCTDLAHEESFKHVRDDAARMIVDQLEKFKKKIPKQGLNNLKRCPWWFEKFYPSEEWKGSPTLVDRMERLLVWHVLYLPPQMVAMGITSDEFDMDSAKSAVIECLELLTELHDNLDSVTVVPTEQVSRWKEKIWRKKKYLLVTAKMLGMVVEN